ncbi:polyprenyl synthetase family protein [Desulfosporosinus youngiae]|uniref:Geranylgeranyl pyrophosphate synthase n=1 Tax=Desulfosporosinus youngiae DSM 17734 TaxID=768710 RepID=H5XVW9_9FIRM|nr:polyprenyl synthetase family protein [Desulfosporosinus youngiae]EHQ90421.1 geranylgeranyl pyrophosphate synthase [Desulfosporosinus youngiae DSM 17734]
MQEDRDVIGQVMLQLVQQFFSVKDLKNDMSDFIMFKMKGDFPFGQLVILHYRMFAGQSKDIFLAAAAVELMILSLDIFDDLQDQDNFSVPWHITNPALAMNIATGLLALSTKAIEQTSFEQDLKDMANDHLNMCVLKAVNGQHTDLMDLIESEEDYIHMVRGKSGSLMAAACLVGTVLAGGKHHDSVNNYAEHIGIIAQIKNDIKDICRWDEKNDLVNKKKTLLTLYLLKKQQPQYQFARDYFAGKLTKGELVKRKVEIQELIEKSGALEYARVIMRLNQLQAVDLIDSIGIVQEWKEKLVQYI